MSRRGDVPPKRRWLDWSPAAPILADSPRTEPTKPSKPGSEGFVGPLPASSANISSLVSSRRGDAGSAPMQAVNSIGSEVDSATREERVMSWSEWKAAALNRLFLEQGTAGQSGRITAETVRHGQRSDRKG
jgi:hypothetical protein